MRYEREFECEADPNTVLRFASNFLNLPIWDPSISGVRKLTGGRVRRGTKFLVRFGFLGSTSDLLYEVVELDPGKGAVLISETAWAKATDTIGVEASARGSIVRWDAKIELALPLSPFDFFIGSLFAGNVERAVANLKQSLDRLAHWRSQRTRRGATARAGVSAQRRKAA